MKHIIILACAALSLSACGVAKTTGKVAAAPVKAAYKTGKFATKTTYKTAKVAYYVGSVPVKVTDKALSTTADVLVITTLSMNLAGQVVSTTKTIQASRLQAELATIRSAKNIVEVIVDTPG